jgi:hypothetical protein
MKITVDSPGSALRLLPAAKTQIYVRRVGRMGDQLWNQEIETVTDVKDSGKTR